MSKEKDITKEEIIKIVHEITNVLIKYDVNVLEGASILFSIFMITLEESVLNPYEVLREFINAHEQNEIKIKRGM